MNFTIRPAKPEDTLQLSILFKQVYIHTYGVEGISKEFAHFMSRQFSEEKINGDILSEDNALWVATYKDNPVGVLQVDYHKACPIGQLVAPEINKLYVLSHFLGKNLGQQLMLEAEQALRAAGKKEVWLWVWVENKRAIRFYEKQNYKWIGNADFQMEENKYENRVMHKKIW